MQVDLHGLHFLELPVSRYIPVSSVENPKEKQMYYVRLLYTVKDKLK